MTPRARWPVLFAAATAALLVVQGARREPVTAFDVAALIALAAPLAWQRSRPREAVCAAAVATAAVSAWVVDLSDVTAMFAVFLGPAFCAGRWAPRARWLLLVLFAQGPVSDLVNPGFDPAIFSSFFLFVLPAWGLGRALAARDALVAELAALNAELAAEQDARVAAAAAAERARIARELHDVVAHALSVMVLQAAGARLAVVRAPETSVGALRVVEQAGREAVAEMGRLLGVLRGDDADTAGLARLDGLAARARAAGLALDVQVDGAASRLTPTVDLAAFRIAQEAVTNAVKHAAPTSARLRVTVDGGVVEVVVEDDGHPDAAHRGTGTGHGLLGIRERVALHGGSVEAAARREGGFRVHARLPVA